MGSMFEGTGLMVLDLDQDPQVSSTNKMGNFYETDLQKAYAQSQGKNEKK